MRFAARFAPPALAPAPVAEIPYLALRVLLRSFAVWSSGILDPYAYRTVEVDFVCDYLLALFSGDGSCIDENMNKE